MNGNTKKVFSGVSLALAAAAMVGCASQSDGNQVAAAASATDLMHCYDVNVCGGHNDCKTASNACAGQASCKGTGFVAMPSKSCADVGGKSKDSWKGSVNVADLAHCYNVNICKGHNDCKTADNACAGHASCKGTGFVAMPAKSCGDIGGEVGA
jgi:hypothetical protein